MSGYFAIKASEKRKTLQAAGKHIPSHYIIIKIAFITGVPNIFAFTIVLLPDIFPLKFVFEIIYSVIYGLQGALMATVFITSSNVSNRILKILTCKSKREPSTNGSTTYMS